MTAGKNRLVRKIQGFARSRSREDVCKPLRGGDVHHSTGFRSEGRSKSGKLPNDIPHGCLAVYVGDERKRFVISTHYLTHHLFKELLKISEEEFGFEYEGGLTIACDSLFFEHLLWLIGSNDPAAKSLGVDELLHLYAVS